MMTPCAVCGSPTADPSLVGFRWDDGYLSGPYRICGACQRTLNSFPPRGMRLVNPDGSPLSTPRGELDPSLELPADGRTVPAAGHPPS